MRAFCILVWPVEGLKMCVVFVFPLFLLKQSYICEERYKRWVRGSQYLPTAASGSTTGQGQLDWQSWASGEVLLPRGRISLQWMPLCSASRCCMTFSCLWAQHPPKAEFVLCIVELCWGFFTDTFVTRFIKNKINIIFVYKKIDTSCNRYISKVRLASVFSVGLWLLYFSR